MTLECAGNGRALIEPRPMSQPWLEGAVGTAEWTGTPLAPLLEEAGLAAEAKEVVFSGLDRGIQGDLEHAYERSLPVAEAQRDEILLAYEINGQPLPPQHGFPLRLIVPGWYGMTHVKWLSSITAVAEPFTGWQQDVAYHVRDSEEEQGEPVTRIQPRSLMVPPGIPEFLSRTRYVEPGPCAIEGRAWSGQAPVSRVEFSDDGGETWADAELGGPVGEFAWRGWSYEWDAAPGRARALLPRDRRGRQRPAARARVELGRRLQQRGAARAGRRPLRGLMDTREAAERWRRTWARGWHGHDAGPILELYAEDAFFQSHPFRDTQAPRDYIEPTLAAEAWADCEFLEPVVDGDRAAVEWSAETRLKDGGAEKLAGVSLLRFDADGLVVEQRDFWASG